MLGSTASRFAGLATFALVGVPGAELALDPHQFLLKFFYLGVEISDGLCTDQAGPVKEFMGLLFTEVFLVPEESDRRRIFLSASDAVITRSSSAVAILDSFISETEMLSDIYQLYGFGSS